MLNEAPFVPFTKDMIATHTILMPNMLPVHFKLFQSIFGRYGYHMELLETEGPEVVEAGLKYTHNDACYPAVMVIGQFMQALLSGRYDLDKTALIMFQTGGGCRASNYISLIRKALGRAGMAHIPVISFSFAGLERHPGFRLPPKLLYSLVYAVAYGDLLLSLRQQVGPYELHPGDAAALTEKWSRRLGAQLGEGSAIGRRRAAQNYQTMVAEFAQIPMREKNLPRVGIVGEIFVKYAPVANNHLEDFLLKENASVTTPGLMDFLLFCLWNSVVDTHIYGRRRLRYPWMRLAFRYLNRKREEISRALAQSNRFEAWTPFEQVIGMTQGYISTAVKMGEGWLLTAEILELAHAGCKNIVCVQPFGCLPNHICGKGMMKRLKERNPELNIIAIDYDASASRVNQENRLKLMLANARRQEPPRLTGEDARPPLCEMPAEQERHSA